MRIEEVSLLDFMGEPDVRFAIPRFQRAYWREAEQCEELWRDLRRAVQAHRTHFLGTLIYSEVEDGAGAPGVLDVVDGQQRLTTVTLILAALAAHLRKTGEAFFGVDADYVQQTFLQVGGQVKLSL